MLVTKDTTEQLSIPGEDGEWMQFRRLSWLEMTEAAETAERRSVKKMTQFGSEAVGAILASHEKTAAATADTDGDGADGRELRPREPAGQRHHGLVVRGEAVAEDDQTARCQDRAVGG